MTNGEARARLLYHFCRLQVPALALAPAVFERHLRRAFALYGAKRTREGAAADWAAAPDLPRGREGDGRWHEEFRLAAREWLGEVGEGDLLILGLRLRYRLSQREVARLLGVHEGNISRQTSKLRDRCLDHVGRRLLE